VDFTKVLRVHRSSLGYTSYCVWGVTIGVSIDLTDQPPILQAMTKGFSSELIRTAATVLTGAVGAKVLLQAMGKDPGGWLSPTFLTANITTQVDTWTGIQSRVVNNMIQLIAFLGLGYLFIR